MIDHYDLAYFNFVLLVSIMIGIIVIVIILLIKQKNSFKTKTDACIADQHFGYLSKYIKKKPPENCITCTVLFECSRKHDSNNYPEKTVACIVNQYFGLMKTWSKNRKIPDNCEICPDYEDCRKNKRSEK